ncbi:hypothetical protein CYMTET_29199 [Cymbomonas tetramitiformis]|uniref:Uncharacterized protein n=1 Tax=Cymbomonas tetramitiformis TaxID=36881 RepID=A0AAE0FMZ5_9CHLO|nr:hypothetical protein CYMTET_29199 [Cymbomonas tetramitiformis]
MTSMPRPQISMGDNTGHIQYMAFYCHKKERREEEGLAGVEGLGEAEGLETEVDVVADWVVEEGRFPASHTIPIPMVEEPSWENQQKK